MRSLHQLFLDGIHEQRSLAGSGRGLVAGPALSRLMAAQTEFESDVDVLNYALTLEHVGVAFYQLLPEFEFGEDGFGNPIGDYLAQIAENETTHLETLTQVITDLGGEPAEAAEYDFGVTDFTSFLATAAILENLDVSAYDGVAAAIGDPDILTAAGGIAAVEARHAAYLNLLTGASPFPSPVETPLTPDEVLDEASQFIVDEDAAEATPEGDVDADDAEATPED
jgi:rubrerythrin